MKIIDNISDSTLLGLQIIAKLCYQNCIVFMKANQIISDLVDKYLVLKLYHKNSNIECLTLCILMDFPIHIETISMGLSFVYFKRTQVERSKL